MRWVDAYMLKESLKESRDRAVEWHNDCKEHSSDELVARSEQAVMTFNECIMRINSMPIVDGVPVVRCKDCLLNGTDRCAMNYGGRHKWNKPNDFCSWGERGEDE